MTECYFAFGNALNALTNIETVIDPPQVIDTGRIPLLRPVKQRDLDGFTSRSGKINVPLRFDVPLNSGRIALNTFLFGDQITSSKELYASALDEFAFYSPYLVIVERPYEIEDYTLTLSDYLRPLVLPCFDWRLQVATKTGNYTVTTSNHYLKANTGSGSITFALPPLAGVNSDVVYSFEKIASANSMILDGNGSETIDGNATKTLTANGARIDIAKINGAWKTVRLGSMI